MTLPIRDFVRRLTAYVPGEQPRDAKIVKLNTNENPYPPAPEVMAALRGLGDDAVRKYPPATADALREAIGRRLGFERERIIVGYGSDEILRLLCHALTGPNASLLSLRPSYSLYPNLGALYEARTLFFDEAPADAAGFGRLPDAYVAARAAMAFLPNPNPPYGAFYPLTEIERLCAADPNRVVVVDEAYVDFAPESAMRLLSRHDNLVVTRTFSKSYSLAGMRVGFAVGPVELIGALMTLKDSYNLPSASQVAALAAWEARGHFDKTIKRIVTTRDRLTQGLRERGLATAASHGNFVFARHREAQRIYETLKARGVLVRYWATPPLGDGIRITVGTQQETDRLFDELDRLDFVRRQIV